MNVYRTAVQNDYKINVCYSGLINELKIGILEREIKQDQKYIPIIKVARVS